MTETVLAVSAAVTAAAAVIAVIVVIPAVGQLRRTAARVERLITRYDEELGPLLVQARHTLIEMERGAAKVEAITGRIDRASHLLDQLNRMLAGVRLTVGKTVTPPVATVAAAVEGVRQALHFLFGGRPSDGTRPASTSKER